MYPVRARMRIEIEIDNRTLQPRAETLIEVEARAADLGGGFGVEDAEVAPEVPMRLRLEAELRRLAAAADFGVLAVVLPDGDARIRQVGDGEQDVLQLLFDLCLTRVVLLNAAGDGLQLLKNSRNVLPRLLEGGDFLIFGILSGLLLLVVRYQRTAQQRPA